MLKHSWRFIGAPLLLIVSLYGLYGSMVDRRDRNDVVVHGKAAQARVVQSSGLESVLVVWTDSAGARRTGQAWTGKPFARQAQAGQEVAIKYKGDPALQPVILSQAPERERVNAWWTNANAAAAVAMTLVCVVIGMFILARPRSR